MMARLKSSFLKCARISFTNFCPEFLATFLVDPDIADDRIFMRSRRHKNQHGVAIARFLHSQLKKFSLRTRQGILFKFPPLNENADLARTFPFRFLNRLDDAVVIEPTKKIDAFASCYQLPLAPPPPLEPPPPLKPLKLPPPPKTTHRHCRRTNRFPNCRR